MTGFDSSAPARLWGALESSLAGLHRCSMTASIARDDTEAIAVAVVGGHPGVAEAQVHCPHLPELADTATGCGHVLRTPVRSRGVSDVRRRSLPDCGRVRGRGPVGYSNSLQRF
jgi:hypothetical protein